ncbi:MAG: hypothetical protein M3466_01130, partial [Gemmatimonadota bacterium]|nr:hypothetical protein [Gemmatimonadota bacterium]
MATTLGFSSTHDELTRLIRRVRAQWRFARAIRGSAIVLGAALVVLLAASFGIERFRFNDTAVIVVRVLAYVSLIALAARYLILPLLPRVSDDQVALFIEEHDPSLDAALVSAIELGASESAMRSDRSPVLSRELERSVLARVRSAELGSRTERGDLVRSTGALALAAAAAATLFAFGPRVLGDGMRALFPWGTAEAAPVYAIAVAPGNVTIARGGDQQIGARLTGFGAERVEIVIKRADSASVNQGATAPAGSAEQWERAQMGAGADSSAYVFRLFDIASRTEYFIEANGVRSPIFRIDVADLPYVQRIDLEYRYPAYTGLAPRVVEDAGDITALEGTTVIVRARPTMPVQSGRIAVEGQTPVPLTMDSTGSLSASIRVARAGFYHLELQAADGQTRRASLDYTIDVLADLPPTVTITKPGRDSKVTSVEEVFAEAQAEDDYGIAKLDLVYSVNGDKRRTVGLYGGKGRRAKQMSAGHTFLLEELSLEPGDMISYFARATDANNKSASTDIYFLQVRPYGQEYRQAEQSGGGGGGGGMEGNEALSARQRDIIAATFKSVRDRAVTQPREYQENLATIALAEGRLREQVATLARRMVERGVAADSSLRKIAELLPKAAEEMRVAEELLGKRKADDAIPPEERALRFLQQAEAAFREVQVSMGGDPSGGGGGGQQTAEELADLFELEVDKLRNQYETVQRGEQQAADEQVDEVLERLKRLAARQQQENERMRERANSLRGQSGSGGGAGQRQLAQEAEEAARRLERLARERSSPAMAETAKRLRDAAESMRRAAGEAGQGAQAGGSSALDKLQDARRLLDKERTGRLERDIQNARRSAEELAQRQREIARDVESLKGGRGGESEERLFERKDSLASGVQQLETQLERMSRDSRREQKDASRKLEEAAGAIRDRQLADRIRYSKGVVQGGSPEYANSFEEQIGSALEGVRDKIAEAAGAIGEPEGRNAERALDRARGLVRG